MLNRRRSDTANDAAMMRRHRRPETNESQKPIRLDFTGRESQQWHDIFEALADPNVTELMVNGPDNVFLTLTGHRRVRMGAKTKSGRMIGHPVSWDSIEQFEKTVTEDVEPRLTSFGKSYRKAYCIYEGGLRLKSNGKVVVRARFHCLKPPVCEFPAVTIAKQSSTLTNIEALEQSKSINGPITDFVQAIMKHKKTIVFSGGTGAGKTTFLRSCSTLINKRERVIVCEDTPELQFDTLPNTVYLMSYPKQPGVDENEQATLSWVVAQTARMRTDRIIIGETRGPEFSDFITAANSGFDGSMTTLHADSPTRALDKMASFIKRAPGNSFTPMSVINSDISHAVNYIIQLGVVNNKYRLIEIDEVIPQQNSNESPIKTSKVVKYNRKTDDWDYISYPQQEEMHKEFNHIMQKYGLRMNPMADS